MQEEIYFEDYNVNDLKLLLKKYDLVTGINSMKKQDLINTLLAVKKYKENISEDYKNFVFGEEQLQLSDEQYNIVTSDIKQNIRIIASAGSGKTTTIICRVKYLIDKGIDPERILVTTFNIDASENLKQKITQLFGFLPKITIGNIDSIAAKFYYRYFKQDHYVSVQEYANYFMKYLQSEGNILSSLYQYVFFDEFQDVNDIQYNIIKCFYDKGAYLTVIGDDSQCIYQFRGSNIKYILNMEKYINNLKTFKLENNYRSTSEIINFANASIKFNTEQIPKNMIPNKLSINFLPQIKYFDTINNQNADIINKIIEFNKQGIPYDDIAVLCRNIVPLKALEEMLEKINKNTDHNINYITLISEENGDTKNKPKKKANHISLTTIHKSKGLEWKIVFIIDCNDSRFPSEVDKLSIQEERRLFYVAITRAKEFLYLYFFGENKNGMPNKNTKMSRFIQEVDKKLYNFVNYDKKYYSYDDYRSIKWTSGVLDTIKLLNETDIFKLREKKIIPEYNPVIKKIHGQYEFNSYINSFYLEQDFGEFIDRYITRSIGKKNIASRGLIDNATIIIISSCCLNNEELIIYKKYESNLKYNIKKLNKNTVYNDYIKLLNQNDINIKSIKKVEIHDLKILYNVVQKMISTSEKFNIDLSILVNCFSVKNEIPDKTKKKIEEAYKKYNNPNNITNDIHHDIYNVSLCDTFLNGRRRLIYKDVFDNFTNGYDNLFEDISTYIEHINPEYTNLNCKKLIYNKEYDLTGEIDMLDIDNNKIVDFKCSSTDKIKLEWVLQLLAYLSIIKKSYKNIAIKELEVYNPMQGEIYTLDISNWDKEDEYLSYLYEIRVRQMSRNTDMDNNKQEIYPIHFNNHTSIKNEKNIIKIDNDYENMDNKIYNLNELFDEGASDYLEYINKNKDKFNQYNELINKFNEYTNNRYIVIDTETTGLPQSMSFGVYPEYTDLEKYKNARMIQICWAIYNNNKLEELQNYIIKPQGFEITNSHIHGITNKMAQKGDTCKDVLEKLCLSLNKVKHVVGHNIKFDINIILSELYRNKMYNTITKLQEKKTVCTMMSSISLKVDGLLKVPKLINLYKFLFGKEFQNQHNAKYDVLATGEIFHELMKRKLVFL